MSEQRCENCKWLLPILKVSENEYFMCGWPRDRASKPYQNAVGLLYARNPRYHHLSVGDPTSDYGKDCSTWEPKP